MEKPEPIQELEKALRITIEHDQYGVNSNKELIRLYLNDQRINSLLPLVKLSELQELYLYNSQILDFSSLIELKELKELKSLYLDNNRIKNFDPLGELKQLEELNLNSNRIADIRPLGKLKRLKRLSLSHNKITDVTPLGTLEQLEVLRLISNKIVDVGPLAELKQMKLLSLNNNRIVDVAPLGELKQLQELNLSNNRITKLPVSIFRLNLNITPKSQRNEGLRLKGNPIKVPPLELIEQGREAVLAYFESIQDKKAPLNEAKVLFVGSGGAGKTTLVKRLAGLETDENEGTTLGVETRLIKVVDAQVGNIRTHLWDFGGQEHMHHAHSFFFTQRCLYVLVLDGRMNENPGYWLDTIKGYGGASPVLVVTNQKETDFSLSENSYRGKYPQIIGFYGLSALQSMEDERGNADQYLSFLEAFQEAVGKIESVAVSFSQAWLGVKHELEKANKDCYDYAAYQNLCERHEVSENHRKILLGHLHDVGVVIRYPKPETKDHYILNPNWLMFAFYALVNDAGIKERKGEFTLDELDKIIKREGRKKGHAYEGYLPLIRALLIEYRLCFEMERDRFLLPILQAEDQPDHLPFDKSGAVRLVFDFNHLSKETMPRLTCELSTYLKGKEARWKYGFVMKDKPSNNEALVVSDESEKTISIWIQGNEPRDTVGFLRRKIREAKPKSENITFEEKVPLPGFEDEYVSYEDLLGHLIEGKEEYFNGKLRKRFSVRELLGTIEKPQQTDEKLRASGSENRLNVHIHNYNQIENKIYNQIIQNFHRSRSDLLSALERIPDGEDRETDDLKQDLRKLEGADPADAKRSGILKKAKKIAGRCLDKDSKLRRTLDRVEGGLQLTERIPELVDKFTRTADKLSNFF